MSDQIDINIQEEEISVVVNVTEAQDGATGATGDTGPAGSTPLTVETPSADYEVGIPTGTFVAGDSVLIHITPTVGINLTFNAAILIPSDSTFNGTKALNLDELYIVKLQYSGSFWMLVTLVGGYA